jgi:formylglycine-generating enzyme required for sulfatase activity
MVLQGKYTVEKTIGTGGMGAVYLARMASLGGKRVAVKEMSTQGWEPDEQMRAALLFQREADILAGLSHPNLVEVFDHFEEAGSHYLVMALVEGETLEEQCTSDRPSIPRVLEWAGQLCDVLSYLHQHEPPVIFRDLKPNNIMLDVHGRIRLVDFGIARFFIPGGQAASLAGGAGTPGYAPLEQFRGSLTDIRSDIYAFGCTLYALLTGKVPPTSIALSSGEAKLLFPQSFNPDISLELQEVVMKMMELRPEDRPQTVEEVRTALQAVGQPAPMEPVKPKATTAPAVVPVTTRVPCPTCQQPVEVTAEVCEHCGNRVESTAMVPRQACPQCSALLPPGRQDCPNCQGHAAQTVVPSVPVLLLAPTSVAPAVPPRKMGWVVALVGAVLVAGVVTWQSSAAPLLPYAPDDRVNAVDGSVLQTVPMGAGQTVYLGKYLVTRRQFGRFVKARGYRPQGPWSSVVDSVLEGSVAPAVYVTLADAKAYCDWAHGRLPTQKEWEQAAYGSDGRHYPWGNEDSLDRRPVRSGEGHWGGPAGASQTGCVDMVGGVWQWTATPGADGATAVLVGGSFMTVLEDHSDHATTTSDPATATQEIGFRVASDAAP